MADELSEQEKINNTRIRISGIKDDVNLIKSSMQEIHTALLGSPLTQDGGLVKRIVENEMRVEKLTIRIIDIERREGSNQVTTTVIWSVGGAILLAIITGIVTQLLKK